MPNEMVRAIASVVILASCMFALYSALAPLVNMKEDKHDDLES
ncbi:hypothetical protein UFOVP496_3 [uncultured Caudovirales phage]|uniref:Uncharacterized protein n=1 Tax=uncultured Caudovirales phage TaxID=2100421 RepID=A0A6J5ML22_9CAUD|nr:hypothetical protein UFOVP496_3 [uncultured Caudovirales phage]